MVDVNPSDIPHSMAKDQLEWWILFGICVANKPAHITREKMNAFLRLNPSVARDPFGIVKAMIIRGQLGRNLRKVRFGQYTRINRAFREAIRLDTKSLTVEKLEAVKGIGPKTARMIILYSQPEAKVVPLDTHILRWLREQGYKAPRSTPQSGSTYNRLEKAFQDEAAKREVSVRQLDTTIWQAYSRRFTNPVRVP